MNLHYTIYLAVNVNGFTDTAIDAVPATDMVATFCHGKRFQPDLEAVAACLPPSYRKAFDASKMQGGDRPLGQDGIFWELYDCAGKWLNTVNAEPRYDHDD